MTPVLVLTTVGAAFDAKSLARELVDLRVAACVNILPAVQSVYRWKNAIEDGAEQLLVIKSVRERLQELHDALLARHPYEVPEFLVLHVAELSADYREWLVGSLT